MFKKRNCSVVPIIKC